SIQRMNGPKLIGRYGALLPLFRLVGVHCITAFVESGQPTASPQRSPETRGLIPDPIVAGIVGAAAPAPRAATRPHRRMWLRTLAVRCSLRCDPPVGGHSCNGGMIPRFHRAVSD